jgi:hypothetical protein
MKNLKNISNKEITRLVRLRIFAVEKEMKISFDNFLENSKMF